MSLDLYLRKALAIKAKLPRREPLCGMLNVHAGASIDAEAVHPARFTTCFNEKRPWRSDDEFTQNDSVISLVLRYHFMFFVNSMDPENL